MGKLKYSTYIGFDDKIEHELLNCFCDGENVPYKVKFTCKKGIEIIKPEVMRNHTIDLIQRVLDLDVDTRKHLFDAVEWFVIFKKYDDNYIEEQLDIYDHYKRLKVGYELEFKFTQGESLKRGLILERNNNLLTLLDKTGAVIHVNFDNVIVYDVRPKELGESIRRYINCADK